jgi:hypothetical protein
MVYYHLITKKKEEKEKLYKVIQTSTSQLTKFIYNINNKLGYSYIIS